MSTCHLVRKMKPGKKRARVRCRVKRGVCWACNRSTHQLKPIWLHRCCRYHSQHAACASGARSAVVEGKGHDMNYYCTLLDLCPLSCLYYHLHVEKSKCMLFFHTFTGCDVVNGFCGKGTRSAWQTWEHHPLLSVQETWSVVSTCSR